MFTGRGWKKKTRERCSLILNSLPLGSRVVGDDHVFLLDVLCMHPEVDAKIGVGVAYFDVRSNEWGGRTFWFVRKDGSESDFSFLKCLTPPSPIQDFAKACRTAVVLDILHFKDTVFAAGEVRCPFTGEILYRNTVHIDHAPPWLFDTLVQEFAKNFGDLKAEVVPTHDGKTVTEFIRQDVVEAFRTFHNERAVLRAVSKTANLSLLRKS